MEQKQPNQTRSVFSEDFQPFTCPGRKYFNPTLKRFIDKHFPDSKGDTYSAFIERNLAFASREGDVGMITIPNWMFNSGFESLRQQLIENTVIQSFVHNGRGVWGSDFGSCSFVLKHLTLTQYRGTYKRLFKKQGSIATPEELRQRFFEYPDYHTGQADFKRIPGCLLAYWISDRLRDSFEHGHQLEDLAPVRQGFQTGNNDRFLRLWPEVSWSKVKVDAVCKEDVCDGSAKWVPYNKGGDFRKWYGNNDVLVAFDRENYDILKKSGNCLPSRHLYFRESITWSAISSGVFGARYAPPGFTFSADGACAFPSEESKYLVLGLLNSKVSIKIMEFFAATIHFNVGNIRQIPVAPLNDEQRNTVRGGIARLVELAKEDWDERETSWDFAVSPLVGETRTTLPEVYAEYATHLRDRRHETKALEEHNNRLFIGAYGLQDELSEEVLDSQLALHCPKLDEDIQRFISYAIGCMMGRYSLDEPGLIYAHSGNQGFDPGKYKTFAADQDGIIPITDTDWFPDDAANRFVEYIATAWPKDHLEENLKFVAESLGPKKGESSRDTIRRYLCQGFFKHHLSMYKKRPIYWLFSSGKQGAFECLVYLHRYNEGTLSRMRTEYVIPLQGKIDARIDQLKEDISSATSTAHGKRLQKEREKLVKQQGELRKFDEKLRHYADLRISLDLDDGVKVNYGKFGDLLAEVKAVTGMKAD